MDQNTLYFTDFEGLVLREALEREGKLLEIVTAKEREAGKRNGWALARIKVRAVRSVLSQVVGALPWEAGVGYRLRPEDEASLAEEVAAVGQKMRPPRADLEKLMSIKARRRAAVRKHKPPTASGQATSIDTPPSGDSSGNPGKPLWTAPKYE